ncbi:MAG: PH domain-containing protein [Lachnospiraceae bacterium]|nr:PH domain-containing protein [Lachnospiraceae bacterium]
MTNENTNILWQDRKHHLWFPISFTSYYIEDDRLMIKKGFFNTTLDETLLYRIIDISFQQTLAGKIFGTGNVILKTKADASGEIVLENIAKPFEVRKMLSKLVEESRNKRNIVGKEFYSSDHMDLDGDGVCDVDEL